MRAARVLKRFSSLSAGGLGAHAGAGTGSARRCRAGSGVVAAVAAAGTAGAVVLSAQPSETWETRGRR